MRVGVAMVRVMLITSTLWAVSAEVQAAPVPWRFEGSVTGFFDFSGYPCGPGGECILPTFVPLGSKIVVEMAYDGSGPPRPMCSGLPDNAIDSARVEVNGYAYTANNVYTWPNGGAFGLGGCQSANYGLELLLLGLSFEGTGFPYAGDVHLSAFQPNGVFILHGMYGGGGTWPLVQPQRMAYQSPLFYFYNGRDTYFGAFTATLFAVPAPPVTMLLGPALVLCLRRRRLP